MQSVNGIKRNIPYFNRLKKRAAAGNGFRPFCVQKHECYTVYPTVESISIVPVVSYQTTPKSSSSAMSRSLK